MLFGDKVMKEMLDLLEIPKECKCDYIVKRERFHFDDDVALSSAVSDIHWVASIKPQLIDVQPVASKSERFEEIQVLTLKVESADRLYDICRPILKAIKYPCLLLMKYKTKYAACASTFAAGKANYSNNAINAVFFSHWIYPDALSTGAIRFLGVLNEALKMRTDIKSIHKAIRDAVQSFALHGTSRAHVQRLIKDLSGGAKIGGFDLVMQYCTPYEYHQPKTNSAKSRYDRDDRYANYTLIHDYEDVWYCFMRNDYLRSVIENRRYRDIEDLVYSIDSKGW